jgi:predicted transcriptional regulator
VTPLKVGSKYIQTEEEQQYHRELAWRLRQARIARGLSRRDLEAMTGIHRNSIANLENGCSVRHWTVIRIRQALKDAPVTKVDTTSCATDAFTVDEKARL